MSPEIWARWFDLVGPAVARRAIPFALNGTTLIVAVASSAWMQELNYLKERMVERFCEEIGPEVVREIRFVLDRSFNVRLKKRNREVRPLSGGSDRLPSEICDALSGIQDEELRQAMESAAKALYSPR